MLLISSYEDLNEHVGLLTPAESSQDETPIQVEAQTNPIRNPDHSFAFSTLEELCFQTFYKVRCHHGAVAPANRLWRLTTFYALLTGGFGRVASAKCAV